jgi:hypothetical protein
MVEIIQITFGISLIIYSLKNSIGVRAQYP